MKRYIIQRVLATIPVMFIVGSVVFFIMHLTPGDPATIMAGDLAEPEQIEKIRAKMGFDKPLITQYRLFFWDIARGDLRHSIFSDFPVTTLVKQRIEPTITIAILGEGLAVLLGVPAGVLAAWRSNTLVDRTIMIFAVLGLALPSFWLGFNLIWLFAIKAQWLPAVGFVPFGEGDLVGWARSLVLPCVTIGAIIAALIARMTRSSMLEVLREDYVRTARAKGLAENVVLIRHALRNAALPIVTIIGLGFAGLLSGLVITEQVFAIPGIGRLLVDGVVKRDFPVIQGVILITAGMYVLLNLLVDLTYGYFDPRVRFR